MIEMDMSEFVGEHVQVDRSGKERRAVDDMAVAPGEGGDLDVGIGFGRQVFKADLNGVTGGGLERAISRTAREASASRSAASVTLAWMRRGSARIEWFAPCAAADSGDGASDDARLGGSTGFAAPS
jgi:hypothetical protein